MNKKIILSIIFYNLCFLLFSQQFSTKIYLQGMSSGKDTLEVGYDPNATRGIDASFGEINYLNSASNNKFNAFIVDPSIIHQSSFFLKKQILNTYTGWIENGALGIIVPYDSLPVTVSWDKSLFANPERDYSLITDWTMGAWFDAGSSTFKSYLKDISSVQIPKTVSNYSYNDGVQQHSMYIFYLAFAKIDNIIASNKTSSYKSEINIYPNQSTGFIIINNKSISNITQVDIFTLNGQLVETYNHTVEKVDCSNWSKGIYMFKIHLHDIILSYKINIK